MHWILGLALAAVVFVVLTQWAKLTPEKKKAATWKLVLVVGGALLLFMVLTGRVHVLTAAVAGLIPLLRKLPALLKMAPFIRRLFDQQKQQGRDGESARQGEGGRGGRTAPGSPRMSVAEACEILGVAPTCTEDEVIVAHRRLMQKIHPDRGGNNYLAAKVNEAKSILLAERRGAA